MKKYVIEKGEHDCKGLHFGITFKKKVKVRAKFTASCLYDLKTNDNYDINKLFGFSTTYYHHNQSARIGWRCVDGETIQIVTYTYNHGERMAASVLATVKPEETFECSIEDIESAYVYVFYGKGYSHTVRVPKQPDKVWFKYLLWPYFGGNIPAPHDMVLYMERL